MKSKKGSPVGAYLAIRKIERGYVVDHFPSGGLCHIGHFPNLKAAKAWAEWINKEGGDGLKNKVLPKVLQENIWKKIFSYADSGENKGEK